MGPISKFQRDAVIAVTGAEMAPKLNARRVAQRGDRGQSRDGGVVRHHAHGATRLHRRGWRHRRAGDPGSRSTYGLGAFGGFQGRKLQVGDIVPVGTRKGSRSSAGACRTGSRCRCQGARIARVPGLYFHRIATSPHRLFRGYLGRGAGSRSHRLSLQAGPPLKFKERKQPFGAGSDPSNIVDAVYPYGSIQVPGGSSRSSCTGTPFRARYAMIERSSSADMDRNAQMQPNNKARFVKVDLGAPWPLGPTITSACSACAQRWPDRDCPSSASDV